MKNRTEIIYATIDDVVAIAKKLAIRYAGLGIVNIEISPDGQNLIITFSDGSATHLSTALFMNKNVYDQFNRGKVDLAQDSEKLGGKLPSYFTEALNILYTNTSVPTIDTVKSALDYLFQTALSNKTFVDALALETQANNTAILNVIKGDYLTSDLNLTLDKSTSGVKINSKPLSDKVAVNETNIVNLQTSVGNLQTSSTALDAEIDKIIGGDYINVDGGLTIVKNPAIGVTITGQNLSNYQLKSEKNSPNGYAGVNASGKIEVAQVPIATPTAVGGVKVGNNLSITSDGTLSSTGIGTNTSKTLYLLTKDSFLLDAARNLYYKERCSSKSDTRYNATSQATLDMIVNTMGGSYVSSSISDDALFEGVHKGVIATSVITYTNTAPISFYIEFYKKESNSTETLIGRSNEKTLGVVTGKQDTFEITTVLNNFTMQTTDRIALKIKASKISSAGSTLAFAIAGNNPTHTIFNFASSGGGGGTQVVTINDVVGLPQVFNGTSPIADVALTGQQFKLNDFMKLVNVDDPKTSYVRSSALNGTGTVLSPFGTLQNALASLDQLRTKIDIMDSGSYTFPTTPNLANLSHFYGSQSDLTGDIKLVKNGSIYYVQNHTGNIEISGNNITLVVLGELYGNLTVVGTGAKVSVKWWDDVNKSIAGIPNIRTGSKLGRYTFGYAASV